MRSVQMKLAEEARKMEKDKEHEKERVRQLEEGNKQLEVSFKTFFVSFCRHLR